MIAETTYKYKLVRSTVDKERIKIDDLHHYILSIMIGDRDLQICITDSRDSRCLLLDDYILENIQNIEEKIDLVHQIFNEHQLLSAGFWKTVKVAFKNRFFTFLPQQDYIQGNEHLYLALGASVDPSMHHFLSQEIQGGDFITVFAAPKAFVQFFDRFYPAKKIQYFHQSSIIIQGNIKNFLSNDRKLFLYVDRFSLHISVQDGKQLVYYNQFIIRRFEDYIKYITLICNQLKVSTILGDLSLWGFLSTKTGHYRQLQRYIPNIILGLRPEELKFGYIFDEIEDNQYFDIFQLSLVEPNTNTFKETV